MGKEVAQRATPSQIQARRTPQQDRAKETVEAILDATAQVLDELGHTKLTTVRVAERSGLNVATLYHYFPNKLALLHALALRFAEQQQEQVDAILASRAERDWHETVDKVIDAAFKFHRTTRGAVALFLARKSYPELRQIDYDRDTSQSEFIASVLAELGVRGSSQELQFKALLLTETGTAMIDYALQLYPEKADAAMDDLKLMVKLYIKHHIRESAEVSSS